ncbi:MAG TPA: DUF4097 family beta strand repeat-containing protein [Bryobacteraceae bacterium]|nr:DUF4097 family beta strand repeat-containing protein [Bryobacteraceae bacterium]
MRNCTRLTFLMMSCLPALVLAQEREMTCDDHWQSDRVSHCEINEMTIPATPSLSVDGGVNGGMTLKGWQRNEVRVRARVQTQADTDDQAKTIARQVIIHTGGGRIIADGPSQGHHESWSVSYEIFVPQKMDLNLKAHNGGIHIADIRGQIEFETTNGGVSLQRLAGAVHGYTTNGGLSVELAGERWEGGQLDARTTNGGVSVSVPDNYSAHLETGTVNGHINVEFPVTVHGEINRQLSIDLGSGGPLIRAVTTNGGVSIKRKAA